MTRLIVLFVTAFVDMVGLAMIMPLLPSYATSVGASAVTVGFLISAFSVAQLAVSPLWGRVSDRYGRRPAILGGLTLTTAGYVVFAFAPSVSVLLLARIVQGIGGGTIGVVQAYVTDAAPSDQRTKYLGWLSAVSSLGAVAGPAFGSAMVALGGRLAPGLGAAALSFCTAIFAWTFLSEPRRYRASRSQAAPHTTPIREAIGRVVSGWNEPAARLIWIYTLAIGAFYGTIQTVPLLLVERHGLTEHSVGYFVMYLGAMGVLVRTLVLGRAVDALGEARLMRLGIALLAAGLATTGVAHQRAVLLLGFTLMPLGTAFLFPCLSSLLSHEVRSHERGVYMSVQHTFGGLSRVVFPLLAGVVIQYGGVGVPFWMAGVLLLAALPLAGLGVASSEAEPARPAPRSLTALDFTGEYALTGEFTIQKP